MRNPRFQAFKFATFYTLFVLFLVSVPVIFYISISIKYSNLQQVGELKDYAFRIEQNIYQNKNEVIPPSLLYSSAIYSKSNLLFSTFEKNPPIQLGSYSIGDMIFYGKSTEKDGESFYIIVAKKHSYSSVIQNAFYIIGLLFLMIFISSYIILRASIKPFDDINNYMQNFFNDAMHELKTPLGVMQLNIEIIKSGTMSQKAIKRIEAALSSLVAVFEDIEYLIKLKNVNYTPEIIDFSRFLEDRCEFFTSLLETKELTLKKSIQKDIAININRTELQRLIDNNITNAIKYSFKSTTIDIVLKKEGDNLFFEITNQGVGIKNIEDIFKRYTKEDEIKGGFGIGLNIVKTICDKYSIKIEVDSIANKYAKFKYIFYNICIQ